MYIRRQGFERTNALFIDMGDINSWVGMSAKCRTGALRNGPTFKTNVPNFGTLYNKRLRQVFSRDLFCRIRNNFYVSVTYPQNRLISRSQENAEKCR